ncbi:MAG TPA: hypothetical protein VM935_06410 [Chitinophagaceae bacterium]|nr:hypothetical protein [Chitinophagaceae bacterium]
MRRILLSALVLSVFSCRDTPRVFGVKKICDGLYREKYRVFSGGAWSAEKFEDYLTDSSHFRFHIGSHDEYGSFNYKCVGDTIIVHKYGHSAEGKKLAEVKKFSIAVLKRKHEYKDVVSR